MCHVRTTRRLRSAARSEPRWESQERPASGRQNRLPKLPAVGDNGAMEAEPKRKRRWFQFSLRTLLIVVVIVAIPCAWLGRKIEQKRREREAVAGLRDPGGTVLYDYEVEKEGPAGPDWLRRMLGENFFNDVVAVYFENHAIVTDERVMNVKELTQLTWLNVYETSVTDAGLTSLKGLTHLDYLNLGANAITDAGLSNLKGLTRLRFLGLSGTHVTDAGVKDLQKALPNCQIGH
jgi:hypothetical protein